MKKSTNESPRTSSPNTGEKEYQVPVVWEMFLMEGGLSLMIILPLVVLFFLKMAYQSV